MKKIIAIWLLLLVVAGELKAQDIQVKRFERNYTSLIASMNRVYDNAGEACALLRFFVRDADFAIEPNLGVLKREELVGEIRLYVPRGTKRLTIRKQGKMPLVGYEIPVKLEPKVTYDVELAVNEGTTSNDDKPPVSKSSEKRHVFYAGVGYNIMAVSGPSVVFGFDINHHNIELSGVYGLNKTDDLYFYGNNDSHMAAYNYQAAKMHLKYGYDFKVADFFSIMPMAGASYNLYFGKEIVTSGLSGLDMANSISVVGTLRLVASFTDRLKLYVTPEYHFAVYKDANCKEISDSDNTFKSWSDGINLNASIVYFF